MKTSVNVYGDQIEQSHVPVIQMDRRIIMDMVDFSQDYPYATYLDQIDSPIIELPGFGWFITGHREINTIMKDDRFLTVPPIFQTEKSFKSRSKVMRKTIGKLVLKLMNMNSFMKMSQKWMVFQDPPVHTKTRKIVQASFKSATIESITPKIEAYSEQLIQEMIEKQSNNEIVDFIEDYAYPLPILVITELLGIPTDKQDEFKEWSRMIIDGVNVNSAKDIPKAIKASIGVKRSVNYIRELITSKEESGDLEELNLLNELILQKQEDPEFTDDHIIANMLLMLIAGHETTVNMLSNTLFALIQNNDQYELLRDNKSFIPGAIEEGLRYNPPVTMLQRRAGEDVEILGISIKEGDIIEMSVHTANHDPRVFKSATKFDVQRHNSRKHLSFGKGIHYCIGAPLARREGEVAIEQLINKFPKIKVINAVRKPLLRFSSFDKMEIELVVE